MKMIMSNEKLVWLGVRFNNNLEAFKLAVHAEIRVTREDRLKISTRESQAFIEQMPEVGYTVQCRTWTGNSWRDGSYHYTLSSAIKAAERARVTTPSCEWRVKREVAVR